MTSDKIDSLIIGAGALGLSAACAFQRNNPTAKIAIIEQGAEKSYRDDKGSQGDLRGSRSVMQTDETFGFISKTWEFMQFLEQEIGRQILTPATITDPYLMLTERPLNAIDITRTLRDRGVSYEYIGIGEANERYGLNLPRSHAGVINALDSKRIDLGKYILSMRGYLAQNGALQEFSTEITGISKSSNGDYHVFLNDGTQIEAGQIVVCAGEKTTEIVQIFLAEAAPEIAMPDRLLKENIRKVPQRTLHLRLPEDRKLYTLYNLDTDRKGSLGFYMFPENVGGEWLLKIGYDPMRKSVSSPEEMQRQEKLMLSYIAQIYDCAAEIVVRHDCYYMIDATHEICAGRIANSNLFVGANFIGYGVMASYGAFEAVINNTASADISPNRIVTRDQSELLGRVYSSQATMPESPAIIGQYNGLYGMR